MILMSCAKSFYYKIYACGFAECGKNVRWGSHCSFAGKKNIYIGNNVIIGRNGILWTTVAKLKIENNVMIGPNVSIQTGNHDYSQIGRYMINVGLDEERQECFGDVVIEDDVWIGTNVVILKGVKIGRGSIIHAGNVITKSVRPYTVYINDKLKINRFSDKDIQKHEQILFEKYGVKYPEYHPKNDGFIQ